MHKTFSCHRDFFEIKLFCAPAIQEESMAFLGTQLYDRTVFEQNAKMLPIYDLSS